MSLRKEQRFFTYDDLSHMPKPQWLIEGLFEANSLVMLAAPSYSYKSFMAIDWLCCLAAGRKWNGRPAVPSKCLYILGEGKSNLIKRIEGWLIHHKLNAEEMDRFKANFLATFEVPQMAAKSSVDNILSGLNDVGYLPNVVVIDTFARSLVGLDENSQKDVGLWIEQADRLRQLGMTVIFLHHTAKNTEFGVKYRGSSAIMGGMDTALTMVRDFKTNKVELQVTKQKDHDEGPSMHFNRVLVKAHPGEEGSMVLVPTVPIDERFTEEGRLMEAMINKMIDDESFDSDRARARELALNFAITEGAAQVRISRRRKELGM